MTEVQADPYADLPPPVIEELQGFAKWARNLTVAMALGLLFPAAFLFVFAFGVVKLIQATQLKKQFPEVASPMSRFPGASKSDVKALALYHPNLKAVLDFNSARAAFWVSIVFPVIVIGGLVYLLVGLG